MPFTDAETSVRDLVATHSKALGVRITFEQLLEVNQKAIIAKVRFGSVSAVVKTVTSTEPFWKQLFQNEMRVLDAIVQRRPRFLVPRLLGKVEGDQSVYVEFCSGSKPSKERYPFDLHMVDRHVNALIAYMRSIARYEARLPNRNVAQHYYDWLARMDDRGQLPSTTVNRLRDCVAELPIVFQHGDLLPTNLLLSRTGVVAVDWEFAGWFFPFFDAALFWTSAWNSPEVQSRVVEGIMPDPSSRGFWVAGVMTCGRAIRLLPDVSAGEKRRLSVLRNMLSRCLEELGI